MDLLHSASTVLIPALRSPLPALARRDDNFERCAPRAIFVVSIMMGCDCCSDGQKFLTTDLTRLEG